MHAFFVQHVQYHFKISYGYPFMNFQLLHVHVDSYDVYHGAYMATGPLRVLNPLGTESTALTKAVDLGYLFPDSVFYNLESN